MPRAERQRPSPLPEVAANPALSVGTKDTRREVEAARELTPAEQLQKTLISIDGLRTQREELWRQIGDLARQHYDYTQNPEYAKLEAWRTTINEQLNQLENRAAQLRWQETSTRIREAAAQQRAATAGSWDAMIASLQRKGRIGSMLAQGAAERDEARQRQAELSAYVRDTVHGGSAAIVAELRRKLEENRQREAKAAQIDEARLNQLKEYIESHGGSAETESLLPELAGIEADRAQRHAEVNQLAAARQGQLLETGSPPVALDAVVKASPEIPPAEGEALVRENRLSPERQAQLREEIAGLKKEYKKLVARRDVLETQLEKRGIDPEKLATSHMERLKLQTKILFSRALRQIYSEYESVVAEIARKSNEIQQLYLAAENPAAYRAQAERIIMLTGMVRPA